MQLDTLLGNKQTKHALSTALLAGKLPHAVLLCGPDGCGRGFAARLLAADFLYPKGGEGAQAVLQDQSPEVLIAQGEGRSGQIPIARIRQIRSDIFLSALSSAGRVVWVRDAHKMAAPAANALLKVLEEPPNDVLFVLTAADASMLPVTVRSRCALYPLAAVPLEQCTAVLAQALPAGMGAELPSLLSALYGGRIGMGFRVTKDAARLAIMRSALALASAAAKGNRYQMLRVFSGYEGRKEEDRPARAALLSDLGDAFSASLYARSLPDLPAVPPGRAAQLLPQVLWAQEELMSNISPKLLFAALAAKLAYP